MLVVCWSCKGGVGTSVVAALAALRSATRGSTVAVGLDGDLAAALGVSVAADAVGFGQWVEAAAEAPNDALERLGADAALDLAMVPPGSPCRVDLLEAAIEKLRRSPATVVIDAGRADRDPVASALAGAADVSLLVVRRCYLALRRCADLAVQPTGVVVVSERGRALTVADIEGVVGAPVVADLAVDEALARTIDAGLLTSRLPRGVLKVFDRVA